MIGGVGISVRIGRSGSSGKSISVAETKPLLVCRINIPKAKSNRKIPKNFSKAVFMCFIYRYKKGKRDSTINILDCQIGKYEII